MGTELNSFGQRIVDDFDAPALAPVREDFLDGAYFVYGHTVFQRWLGMGFQSEWAKTFLPERRGATPSSRSQASARHPAPPATGCWRPSART